MNRAQNLESHTGRYAPSIVVLGSCFMDYIAYVDHVPQIGETMHSQSFQKGFGGKGANQAVAAGRLGAKTAMIGMLGGDGDGAAYLSQLNENGVNTQFMLRDDKSASGLAMIFVETRSSNNEIVICPNATKLLTPERLRSVSNNYAALFPPSVKFLICQNEIPLMTTLDVMKYAHEHGVYTIFNAAPAPKPEEVQIIKPYLKYVSLFCPNEVEAAMMTNIKVTDSESAFKAIHALQMLGIRDVVITLGAAGFALSENGSHPVYQPGCRVKAVDTTGAGDAFVGAMAFFFTKGHNLLESCKRANVCAALSVTRKGTQASYPTPQELPKDLI